MKVSTIVRRVLSQVQRARNEELSIKSFREDKSKHVLFPIKRMMSTVVRKQQRSTFKPEGNGFKSTALYQ